MLQELVGYADSKKHAIAKASRKAGVVLEQVQKFSTLIRAFAHQCRRNQGSWKKTA